MSKLTCSKGGFDIDGQWENDFKLKFNHNKKANGIGTGT